MSRSIKKNPVVKDGGKSKKKQKTQANRKVRRKLNNPDYLLADGNDYRKVTESWGIADFICRQSKEDAIKYYNDHINPDFYMRYVMSNNFKGIKKKFKTAENYVNSCVENFLKDYPTLNDYLADWEKYYLKK